MDESEARELIRQNPLKTATDIKRAQTDLSGLLYFVETNRSGTEVLKEQEQTRRSYSVNCSECGVLSRVIYFYMNKPFCPEHVPSGISFPIGMHGEDFEIYKERNRIQSKRGSDDTEV